MNRADEPSARIGDLSPDGKHMWGSGGAWEPLWLLPDEVVSGWPLLRAPVHGDLNPRNLIFHHDNLVAVIDWEVAQIGFGAPDTDPRAFFRRYLDAGGPLTPDDFELLGGFARMGALSEVQWTTHGGRAERAHSQAVSTLREVAAGITWLREREGDL